MDLLSIFKRSESSTVATTTAPAAVVAARTRARRRLIGASVLLAIGVIGFPILFENQPRPIAVDIPIEIPRRETAPPLAMPSTRPALAVAAAPPDAPAESVPLVTTPSAAAPASVAVAAPSAQVSPVAPAAPPRSPASVPTAAVAKSPPAEAPTPPARSDDGQRAQALLEGKTAAASASAAADANAPRLIVQVGAYTDADKLREARQKVEKLGLKTFIQVIESDGTRRTRVRVGPFTSRAEAEQAAQRIKAADLPAAILAL